MSGSVGFMKRHKDMGAVGCIGAVVNIYPDAACDIYHGGLSDEEQLALEGDLGRVHNIVCGKWGIAGLKYAMDLQEYYGGPCREPLLPLDEHAKADIMNCLDDFDTD